MATPAAGDNRRLAIGSSSESYLKDENLRRQESQSRRAQHSPPSTQHPKPRAQDPESWLQVQLLSVVEGKEGAESHMLSLVARQALRSLSCLVFSSVCSLCLPQCVGYTERNLKPIQKLARQPRKSLEFENLFKICLKVCYKNSFFDL